MNQKFWQHIVFRLFMSISLLPLATWQLSPNSASASTLAAAPSTSSALQVQSGVRTAPAQPAGIETLNFTAVTAGSEHTCALVAGGGVKCWGDNENGQLGDGTLTQHSAPVGVVGLTSGVIVIAAGSFHTCAVVAVGVKCWGRNDHGQLGDGTTSQSSTPVSVVGLTSGVSAITAGFGQTCALVAGGGVKCWGSNWKGELGDGTTTDSSVPVYVSGLTSGANAIAAGSSHTCAMVSGGVKCWGWNQTGQLGDGTTTDRHTPVDVSGLASGVTTIDAGDYHTCALVASGVKCWGWNGSGTLGDGTTTQRNTPVNVTGLTTGVTTIASGGWHNCALAAGGGVKCWGYNGTGPLGDGTTLQRNTPVDVVGLTGGVAVITAGREHTCALVSGGGLKCWGWNGAGQLGNGTMTQRSTPVDVTGLTSGVTAATAGRSHTCALVAGGGVKCWGTNGAGQLGDGTTTQRSTPVDVVGLTSGVTAISANSDHTCVLVAGGGVKCWGENGAGQLGDGTTTDRNAPVDVSGLTSGVTAIVAGYQHTCAVVSGGVKCWGANWYGQLGDGTTTGHSTPMDVAGLTTGVTAITASSYGHTCAVVTGGGVKCWGYNGSGQLGDGTTTQSSTPMDVVGLSGVTALASGDSHTCALASGGMKCWGYNGSGQLGDGTTTQSSTPVNVAGLTSSVTAIDAGEDHSCALLVGGAMKCWGANGYGQLGDGTISSRNAPVDVAGLTSGVSAIATGRFHTCALVGSGRPKCWGWDGYGQLGIGTITQRLTPVNVIESAPPSLTINHTTGQPGSFFTITGWNFPPDTQATLSINGQVITSNLPVDSTGSFIFFLNTAGDEAGGYAVTVSVNPSATTSFILATDAVLQPQEGGGQVFAVPAGIAYTNFLYLPLVKSLTMSH